MVLAVKIWPAKVNKKICQNIIWIFGQPLGLLGCPFLAPLENWAHPNSNYSFPPVLFVATAIAMKMMDHHHVTGYNFTILLHTWYWSVRKRDILSKKGKLPVAFTFIFFQSNQIQNFRKYVLYDKHFTFTKPQDYQLTWAFISKYIGL